MLLFLCWWHTFFSQAFNVAGSWLSHCLFWTRSAVYCHVRTWHGVHLLNQLQVRELWLQPRVSLNPPFLIHNPASQMLWLLLSFVDAHIHFSLVRAASAPPAWATWQKDTKRRCKTNKGCHAILLNPPFLFIPSCLEQITVCRHILAPRGAFSAVQVLWPGRQTGGPGRVLE